MVLRTLSVSLLLASTVTASAQDNAQVIAVPGEETGRIDGRGQEDPLRTVGRAVLFVPKVLVGIGFAPVRTGVYLYDKYQVEPRLMRLFFDDDEIYGLYPTAQFDSTYGVGLGARFVHRDLFGEREHLSLTASAGGRGQRAALSFRTGERLGEDVGLELAGELDRRPEDRFYGFGNLDDGMKTRHRKELARARAVLDVEAVPHLHVAGAGSIADIEYARSDTGPAIDMVYGEEALTGWTGVRELYGELELRWDDRRPGRPWDPPPMLATGQLAAVFVGRAHQFEAADDYTRYGLELQRFLRLGEGPRVLVARLYGEGVTGSLDEVPFTQLPQLGGNVLLRGYAIDQFRDRVAALGTLEYRWALSYRFTGSTFVDAGRVYPSLSDIGLEDMRVGYGVGVEYQTKNSFVGQVSLASSIDGGVFLNLVFDPGFDPLPRVERR